MSVTDERKATIDFTKSYYDSGSMAVAQDGPIKSMKDLKGKTVAVKAGTSGHLCQVDCQKYGFKLILQDGQHNVVRCSKR